VEGMPVLPAGKAYQAWFTRDGTHFEPSDVFTTRSGGVWLHTGGTVADYQAMAFTIEDAAGAKQPTQAPFVQLALKS
jgi:hypothetical protein